MKINNFYLYKKSSDFYNLFERFNVDCNQVSVYGFALSQGNGDADLSLIIEFKDHIGLDAELYETAQLQSAIKKILPGGKSVEVHTSKTLEFSKFNDSNKISGSAKNFEWVIDEVKSLLAMLNDCAQGKTTQELRILTSLNILTREEIFSELVKIVEKQQKQKQKEEWKSEIEDFDEQKDVGVLNEPVAPPPAAPITGSQASMFSQKSDELNEDNTGKDSNEPKGAGFACD